MGNPLARVLRSLKRSVLVWTLIVTMFAPFLASPASAQVTVVGDIPRTTDNILNTIFTNITRAGMVALFNAFQTFLGQLAYDAADYIATGGSGQSATFYKKGVGDYLRDVASDAAGEFISSLSSEEFFRSAGFDLCRPDPRVLLRVQLSLGNFFPGLQSRFQRPRPRCDFKDIIKNYDQLYQSLTNEDVLKNVQLSLNTNSSDLGVTFNILNQFSKKIATNVEDRLRERTEGGGFKSVNNILSGTVKTPAQVVNETAREQLVRFPNASLLTSVGATLSSGLSQGFVQLAAYTSSIFINTLTSKLLRRIFEGGLDAGVAQLQLGVDEVVQTRQLDTRNVNLSLKTPNLQKVEEFDVVTELTSCPNESRGIWNCTIDQGLRSALVRNDQGGMTIQAALNAGLLHPDWQLIPASDLRRNQDRNCYTNAYCAGNLQKLRALRILPVGVELAANSSENARRCGAQGAGCVTLGEVVEGFTRCQGSEAGPWCRLVDPNWILTALPQQCVLKGYGDQLISSVLGQRREECQDVQTCLRRDDQGRCIGGYGYCVAEKSVYRFGADECLPREASCRSYQTRGNQNVSYLRNTIDQATCSADNVGCLWYATTRDASIGDTAWVGTTSTGPRVYFDKEVEECASTAEGCTKVKEAVVGQTSLNLLLNPSFERTVEGVPDAGRTTDTGTRTLDDWTVAPASFALRAGTPPTVSVGAPAADGVRAVDVSTPEGAAATYQQAISLTAGRIYTVSLMVRAKNAGGSPSVSAQVGQYRDRALTLPASATGYFRSSGCDRSASVPAISEPRTGQSLDTSWQRFECSFVAATSTVSGVFVLRGQNVLVDSVQIEEGEFATDFVDGVNPRLAERHLKIAPDEFTCTGVAGEPAACSRFARVCRQTEAGCNGYVDVANQSSEVPAILSTNDLCPAQCVGYAEYRKAASAFDLVADADTRFSDPGDASSTYFIPSTAASCRREEVGCEAFTNVQGTSGEQQAYFSYVRSCRAPGPNSQTFFTWEGSDTAGYQLRTWSLVNDAAIVPAPLIVAKREPGTIYAKDPLSCNEASFRGALDPDCRQFYDADGRISYRYYSQTVLSTPQCTDFRIARSSRADCEKTDGTFDLGTSECVYHVYVPQSQLCRAEAVGCREYRGATSGGALSILNETFRDATNTRRFVGARLSSESLLVGDQSLRMDVPARTPASVSVPFASPSGDAFYNVSFWAKAALSASSTVQLGLRNASNNASAPVFVGSVRLGTEWQRYTVGPFNRYPSATSTQLIWTALEQTASYVMFLDEVAITRAQDVVYARRDTWLTPAICDQNTYGIPQPQAMLGCRTYRNRQNQNVNVREFTRLCRQEAIGCKGFVDTRNSTDVGSQTFVRRDTPAIPGFGGATTTRPADRMLYLIDEERARCTTDQNSCRAFGKPRFSADRQTVLGYTTVYLKDDITRYERMLCRPSELFCEEFTHDGAKEYFRNPDSHICEYREEVNNVPGMPPGTYAGWFQVGVQPATPCYPDLLESGRTFGLAKRGDISYRGWVGLCRASAGECTELRDPVDVSDPARPLGKQYYFVRNDRLDTASCAGNVDPGNGCILLRDTSDTQNRYNAQATYARQQSSNRLAAIPPVDCERDPNDPNCRSQATGRCTGTILYCPTSQPNCTVGSGVDTIYPLSSPDAFQWNMTEAELNGLITCRQDSDCADGSPTRITTPNGGEAFYRRTGTCEITNPGNNANLIVKVNMDRDCAQWLGCSSSEVVFDPATNRSRNLCTNLSLCDQGTQTNADPYCTRYVDRASTSTEPILARGLALTSSLYTSRTVGLGQKDYSGYAIPNSFLATDLVNARVALDGTSGDNRVSSKYSRDYRLVAAIPMPPARDLPDSSAAPCNGKYFCFNHNQPPVGNQAKILDRRTPLGVASPNLHLCQQLQTGLIGYFLPAAVGATSTSYCYVAAAFDPLTLGNSETRRSPYDFQVLAETFITADPARDVFARQAFPVAECRAYPQPDAPFASAFVTRWDLTKSPPKPLERVPGFTRVNVCEYGEDCLCTYKRADYNDAAISKFYNTESQDVLTGVCVGGPRDGEGCIPGSVLSTGSGNAPSNTNAVNGVGATGASAPSTRQRVIEASNASQSCGDPQLGGRCVALSRVETVRGVFGQCLERDNTRSVRVGDTNEQPCLTWSPGPILFGEKDVFHYTPSSGYAPPPSSGQYYCTSPARKSRTLRLESVDFDGSANPASSTYAGQMHGFYYDDLWVSDEGKSEASIDGVKTDGSQVAQQCEDADDDQDNDDSASDPMALRLVNTGHSNDTSYTETFFQLNAPAFVSRLFNSLASTEDAVRDGLSDSNIGYISIAPFENKNGVGRIACGYQADWVDGMPSVDYDSIDSSRGADQIWRQKFFSTYNPIMTRATEKLLTGRNVDGSSTGVPVAADCVKFPGIESSMNQCYFKTWEVGHRLEGQAQAFSRMVYGESAINTFENIRRQPEYEECQSDKPYFGIRAVFQTDASVNYQGARASDFRNGRAPRGPWRLVGFWVASCAGAANDVRYMYMNVDVTSADICKELAEVRSKDSLQDAAFTDRVWKEGSFNVPRIGIPYGVRFSPFASALTTRAVGNDDQALFQTGQELAGFSPLSRPTFLASGADTYYRPDAYPKDKWAYLSNLFGRVYRIYRYEAQPVTFTSNACLYGPFKGRACDPSNTPLAGTYATSSMCSLDGECDTSAVSRDDLSQYLVCDSLSGINAGLSCAGDPDICHTGAIKINAETGARQQALTACQVNEVEGWRKIRLCAPGSPNAGRACRQDTECGAGSRCIDDPRGLYDYSGTSNVVEGWTAAEANERYLRDQNASTRPANPLTSPFACAGGIRAGQDCSALDAYSRECPLPVYGKCVKDPLQVMQGEGGVVQSDYAKGGRCAFPRLGPNGETVLTTNPLTPANTRISPGSVVVLPHNSGLGNVEYDVVRSEEYEECYADYDCSFTGEYNYYLKRSNGFSTIYSPRSYKNLADQGSEYGVESGQNECVTGNAQLNAKCLYSTRVDIKSCGGYASGAGHIGTRTGSGGACVLQAWRYGFQPSGNNPTQANQSNQCSTRNGSGLSDNFEDKLAGPSEMSRFPGVVQTSVYQRLQVAGLNLNALVDAREGIASFRDFAREYWYTGAGLLVPLSTALDALATATEEIVNFIYDCSTTEDWQQINFGTCAPLSAYTGRAKEVGRCKGGVFDGKICRKGAATGTKYSCKLDPATPLATAVTIQKYGPLNASGQQSGPTSVTVNNIGQYEAAINVCGAVAREITAGDSYAPVMECALNGSRDPNATNDPDKDNNICTHGTGYRPRIDICPDPSDEFCGLIAYKRGDTSSLSPRLSPYPVPTDVTMGHYTPDYLFNGRPGGNGQPDFQASNFSYIATYKPQPPVIAALDPNECRQPGQCKVTRVKAFNFNGQAEGPIVIAGGQHKSTIQFYGWAAHNQMPIRKMVIDWGDGFKQELPDAKIKNHKPMCGGTKECYIPAGPNRGPTGLTCNTDADCPGGYGRCESLGSCSRHSDRVCTKDTDCYGEGEPRDTCNIRPFFGNSAEACESNYFEFSHVYTCDGAASVGGGSNECNPAGTTGFRCSGNADLRCGGPSDTATCAAGDRCIPDLAPKAGCWDPAANTCRFTPRVLIEDNWGWCTGECRSVNSPAGPTDAANSNVLHQYGGCYAGVPLGASQTRSTVNLNNDPLTPITDNECSTQNPRTTGTLRDKRPWIVYPGSLQLRSRR